MSSQDTTPVRHQGATTECANQRAERIVLHRILVDPSVMCQVSVLQPEDFQVGRNQWVFRALVNLHEASAPIEYLTVVDELERMGKLVDAGGSEYVLDLLTDDDVPGIDTSWHWAQEVRKAKRRQIALEFIQHNATALRKSRQNGTDPLDELKLRLEGLSLEYARLDDTPGQVYSTWADLGAVLGPIEPAWDGWLYNGYASMIASEPGRGKSTVALRIAACYLLGKPWPDGTPFVGQRGRVVWCETEGAQGLNWNRARAWGLPADRILSPTGNPLDSVNLDDLRHLRAIEALAQQDDVGLIVLDSLSGGHTRSEKDTETGLVVKALAEIARDANVPLLITHHLNKAPRLDRISLMHVRGSTSIVQYARVVWALDAPDPNDQTALRCYVIKNNLAPAPEEIGLTIDDAGIHAIDPPKSPAPETPVSRAADLLLDLLDREPMQSTDIEEAFSNAGISWAAARRAKRRLSIVSVKQANGKWYWSLPANRPDETLH